ncbi:ABC transporter substrate-binding protein [Bacillus alkalicellulosilyticus]|uniref:ABC transporter substrate-binding protein n=1 Tax=Alkalihalobacterium alkalicellulosilyticum TaxID=1912214 RepID=UPI0009987E9E|nr:ABC transporter substrate-binding protein [Bacillus alkalicellulosilyticus]
MRRWKLSVVIVLITVLFLGACKSIEDYEEEPNLEVSDPLSNEENEELRVRHFYSEQDSNRLTEMIKKVEERTGVTMTLNPQGTIEYEALLKNELSRRELPHIIEIYSSSSSSFVSEERDHLLDLTDFLEESGLMDQFYSLDSFTIDDRIYGLPFSGSTNHLFYNEELLEELGGVPQTWDEFIDRMEEASRAGYTPIVFDEYGSEILSLFEGVLQRTAGKEKMDNLMNGQAKWTDAEFVFAFEVMESMTKIDVSLLGTELDGDPMELIEAFLTEDILFIYTGDFLANIQSSDEFAHMDGNIGVMALPPVPGAQGDPSSIPGNFLYGFVFRADVTEIEEQMIYQFIETLWSEEFLLDYNLNYGFIPALRVEPAMNNELLREVIKKTNEATSVFPELRSVISYEYQQEIRNVLKGFMDGKQSVNEATEALQKYHEEILSKVE